MAGFIGAHQVLAPHRARCLRDDRSIATLRPEICLSGLQRGYGSLLTVSELLPIPIAGQRSSTWLQSFRTREKEPRLIAGEALRGFSARSKGIRAHARYHHVAAIRKIIATFCPPCEAQRTLEHAALSLVPPRHRVAESAPSPEPVSDEPVDTTAPVVPLRRRSREFPAHLTREMVEHKPQDCDCPECGGRLRMN